MAPFRQHSCKFCRCGRRQVLPGLLAGATGRANGALALACSQHTEALVIQRRLIPQPAKAAPRPMKTTIHSQGNPSSRLAHVARHHRKSAGIPTFQPRQGFNFNLG